MKRNLLNSLMIILIGLMLWGCSESESGVSEGEEKIPVEVRTVELGKVVQSLSYNGDIEAEYQVKVFSKIPDRIETLYVNESDAVQKGDRIANIAATAIEQSVRQAQAALTAARAREANLRVEFERAQRLYRANAMSKQQYDTATTQYEAIKAQAEEAEAMLSSAKSNLNDAAITAPIRGIIGKRYLEAGDMASPSMPLVSIVQMDRVKIMFDVTETDLGKLKTGQVARISVKAFPNRVFEGKVHRISPVLDPVTRMASVEVLIENKEHLLKPGMFANVEVTTGVITDVIVIPRYAIIENTTIESVEGKDRVVKNYYVFVADSSKAKRRKLDVIYANHDYLAVSAGIAVGEKLVTLGQNTLRNGLPVMIVNEEGAAQ